MNKLKVLELFAGIGACSKALERLGIDYEIVDAVEIDKYAIKSFNAIHNTNFEPQDICNWDKDVEVDLIMHGSPCQDFSLAGKQAGGDKGSGTRSSLMYETIRIVEKIRPKYIIWENVKNVLSQKHEHNFYNYLSKMRALGYVNYWQVLNAKDYGIPQNRERVFTISILGGGMFEFPPKQELKLKLKDMLEDEVDEKYYLSEKTIKTMSKYNENYKPCGIIPTLTTELAHSTGKNASPKIIKEIEMAKQPRVIGGIGEKRSNNGQQWYQQDRIYDNAVGLSLSTTAQPYYPDKKSRIRKLSPKECYLLMGFDDVDFEKVTKLNSDTQLYKQAGNSIVVNVLEAILNNLLLPKKDDLD